MLRTILEDIAERQLPSVDWKYVGPSEVSVKTAAPKWTWMARVCSEIPEGKCLMFPVPNGMACKRFAYLLRQAIGMSRHTFQQKFSIRCSRDEKSVVVLKGEDWVTYYRRMESAA